MANYPSRPSDYCLEPGKRYLHGQPAEVPPTRDGSPTAGMTSSDRKFCENWAWDQIISVFGTQYDVDTWDHNAPPVLRPIWELLASAHYMRMALEEHNVRDVRDRGPADRWHAMAEREAMKFLESDQRFLMGRDGTQFVRRDDVAVPELRVSGTRFFGDLDSDIQHGRTSSGSVEETFKLFSTAARTSS